MQQRTPVRPRDCLARQVSGRFGLGARSPLLSHCPACAAMASASLGLSALDAGAWDALVYDDDALGGFGISGGGAGLLGDVTAAVPHFALDAAAGGADASTRCVDASHAPGCRRCAGGCAWHATPQG